MGNRQRFGFLFVRSFGCISTASVGEKMRGRAICLDDWLVEMKVSEYHIFASILHELFLCVLKLPNCLARP